MFGSTVIAVKLLQEMQGQRPMLVMLLEIATLVRAARFWNANVDMLVMGKPLVEAGMVTAPEPTYPTIFNEPSLLVVKLN